MRSIFCIAGLLLVSCQESIIEFVVHNQSDSQIDTVKVTSSDSLATFEIISINPNSQNKGFLDLANVIKTDGDYIIEVNSKGQNRSIHCGYYTNGWPSEEIIDIYVTSDSIKCKATLRK